MSTLTDETRRRRTFAIISHPDAGKTTLTEKLLLFGGAELHHHSGPDPLGQLRISSLSGPNYAYLHGRHRVNRGRLQPVLDRARNLQAIAGRS